MGETIGHSLWRDARAFADAHPGIVLDAVVLLANLLAMPQLVRALLELVARASAGDPAARWGLLGFLSALFFLQPVAAVLKRWHYHQSPGVRAHGPAETGCLFNPITYFCLQVVVWAILAAVAAEYVLGIELQAEAGPFFASQGLGLVACITSTWLVFRYFDRPAREPRTAFLRGRGSERLGDALIYVHALGFVTIWNLFAGMEISRVDGVGEFFARLGFMVALMLLLYFPPRLLYLAEELRDPRAWAMMLVANAPIFWRGVIGTGTGD